MLMHTVFQPEGKKARETLAHSPFPEQVASGVMASGVRSSSVAPDPSRTQSSLPQRRAEDFA